MSTLRRLLERLGGRREPAPVVLPPSAAPPPAPPPPPDSGFWPRASERPLSTLSDDELIALENADIPAIGRTSDASEAAADELQNPITSLNFPLHWTSAAESWRYLYDLSIACDMLGARPDDVVLDFAAGTCWASECLLRLGLRPVAVDLSIEMMRRGRERFAADTRLVFRDEARFVTARGQQLPFRSETFDGVLCMNALHHMPSYLEALQEIYRILKPGGRAVFSEPGTGHADEALSRYRMREEQVMEKSVALPLIRHLAVKAGFTRMRVVPLRASATYAIDYDGSPETSRALADKWTETIRHAPAEHARFALYKGDAPPDDTLLPAPLLAVPGRLSAAIVLPDGELSVRAGGEVTQRLHVTNGGTLTWKARGRRFGGQVTCGLKVFAANGSCVREDLGRTPLPKDVGPGETIDIEMTIHADLPPGRYSLLHDMVVEGVSWFEHYGSATPRRRLTVT